jgi:hypothetical protein
VPTAARRGRYSRAAALPRSCPAATFVDATRTGNVARALALSRGSMPERFVGKPSGDGVSQWALGPAAVTPQVRVGHPALEHGPIRLKTLADDRQAEVVQAAEHGQVRASEGSVEHVEVFRMAGMRNPILGDLDPHPASGAPTNPHPQLRRAPYADIGIRGSAVWPGSSGQVRDDRLDQAAIGVGGDELNPGEAAGERVSKEANRGRTGLRGRDPQALDFAVSVGVENGGKQHDRVVDPATPRIFIVGAPVAKNVNGLASPRGRWRNWLTCSSKSVAIRDTCDLDSERLPRVLTSLSIRRVETPAR